MADKKNVANEATMNEVTDFSTEVENDEVVAPAELNLDAKVTVKNLAGWNVGFARIQDGIGDVNIVAEGSIRLSRNEIIAQIQSGNKLFTGVDGRGSHATLYIDDAPTRYEVDFESKRCPQAILTDKVVNDLFSLNQSEFERQLPEKVVTRAEKYAVMNLIKKLKLDGYQKIRFTERYTGYTL